jgi:hypothetical protein
MELIAANINIVDPLVALALADLDLVGVTGICVVAKF